MPKRSRFFLSPLIVFLAVSMLVAQQPRRQPPAQDYIKILEAENRVARLKIPEVIKTLGLKPGDVVADIGSGSGVFTRPIAQAVHPGGKVFAVDIDKELLDHVAKTAQDQGISNITTVLAEFDSPALQPRTLDLALICDTLHHIEHRETYLKNLRPSMKPTGRLAIIDFSDEWPNGHESMKFSLEDVDRWTQAAGFMKTAEYSSIKGNFFHIYQVR